MDENSFEPDWEEIFPDRPEEGGGSSRSARDRAHRRWVAVVNHMRGAGTWDECCESLVEDMIVAEVLHRRALEEIAATSLSSLATRDRRQGLNSVRRFASDMAAIIQSCVEELGLSPKSAGRVVKIKPKAPAASAKYLRPVS